MRNRTTALAAAAILLSTGLVLGQDAASGREAFRRRVEAAKAADRQRYGEDSLQFGTQCCQITQLPASAFQRVNNVGVGLYSEFGYRWINDSGICCGELFGVQGPVQLPSGTRIRFLDLYFDDSNGIDPPSVIAKLVGLASGTPATGPPTAFVIATVSSAQGAWTTDGHSGYAFSNPLDYTVNNDVAYDPTAAQLVVKVYVDGDFPALHFKAVDIWWERQVGPAPAVATFADVPTNHGFFQFIEALAAAGITSGCATNPLRYCPDQPITRGQMAVFLAKALGLYWQY